MIEIKLKDYKTITYRGLDIRVAPELIQELHANMVDIEEFKNHLQDLYLKKLLTIRKNKINQILK